MNKSAIIKELKNDKYEVQIGIASVKVGKEDLQKDNNPKINNNKKSKKIDNKSMKSKLKLFYFFLCSSINLTTSSSYWIGW